MPASDVNEIRQYLDKSGCPVCARLKKCQSDLLGGDALADAHGICNFHAWALAKSAPAVSAAGVFLSALREAARSENACSFCARLSEMESQSIAALRQLLTQQRDKEWMHRFGRLCLAHALELERLVSDPEKNTIREIVQRIREELDRELASLLRNSSAADSSGGGVLGRAAEFLASQRGLGNLDGVAGRRK
jgi:hypothetical protein